MVCQQPTMPEPVRLITPEGTCAVENSLGTDCHAETADITCGRIGLNCPLGEPSRPRARRKWAVHLTQCRRQPLRLPSPAVLNHGKNLNLSSHRMYEHEAIGHEAIHEASDGTSCGVSEGDRSTDERNIPFVMPACVVHAHECVPLASTGPVRFARARLGA